MKLDPQSKAPSDRHFSHDFVPGSNDVIIGKGKKANNHVGTRKLHCILVSRLNEYSIAKNKDKKSDIISSIVSQVRSTGSFIKMDKGSGLYFDVGDFFAREKISRMFRDYLGAKYKSSTVSRRKQCYNQKAEIKQQEGWRFQNSYLVANDLDGTLLNSVHPAELSLGSLTEFVHHRQDLEKMKIKQSTLTLDHREQHSLEYQNALKTRLTFATNKRKAGDEWDHERVNGVHAHDLDQLQELDVTGLEKYDIAFDENAFNNTFSKQQNKVWSAV